MPSIQERKMKSMIKKVGDKRQESIGKKTGLSGRNAEASMQRTSAEAASKQIKAMLERDKEREASKRRQISNRSK